ncbi:MAG: DNA primase [Patescibacteria group bacterium]
MPNSTVEQIKEKLDVAEFLKGYLTLRPAGKNFKALCPFHREKSPSFMISPDRQSWHCFGCNIGGDIFSFLMRYENIEFAEALKILAEKAGIELQRVSPADYRLFGLLYDLNDAAKEFYIRELKNSEVAINYLKSRGLKPETAAEFEIGFAPSSFEALNLYLLNLGNRPDDILRAGLAVKSEKGVQFDRFRGRIMFPIRNNLGKVVGFTGRVLPELDNGQSGKYINSPETAIFNKSKIIYGFSKAKDFIRESKSVLLVEGQMDMIMAWQSGIKNVVACSGTALTLDHLRALKRFTDQILISFDTDEAGLVAGERAIDLAENMDFNVKVVAFKGFKDAAEAAQADPEKLKEYVSAAIPAPKFYFERYLSKTGSFDNRETLNNLRVVLAKIKNISSPVEQNYWLKELGTATGVPEKTLNEETEKLSVKSSTPVADMVAASSQPADFIKTLTRWDIVCQRLLSALFEQGNFELAGNAVSYLKPEYQDVLEILKRGEKKSVNPILDRLLELVMLRSETVMPDEVVALKNNLLSEYLKEKRQEVTEKIKRAETAKDESALESALTELHSLNSLILNP